MFSFSLSPPRLQQEGFHLQAKKQTLTRHASVGALTWDFPASKAVQRNHYFFLKEIPCIKYHCPTISHIVVVVVIVVVVIIMVVILRQSYRLRREMGGKIGFVRSKQCRALSMALYLGPPQLCPIGPEGLGYKGFHLGHIRLLGALTFLNPFPVLHRPVP